MIFVILQYQNNYFKMIFVKIDFINKSKVSN